MKDYSELTSRIYTQLSPELAQEFHNMLTDMAQEISRLYEIDNTKPSEALECSLKLYKMVESAGNGNGFNLNEAWNYRNTIKQALLKAQENEKALSIIKEKLVDMFKLYNCKSVEEYNDAQYKDCRLTKEEFDLLKRCLKNE